MSTLNRLSSLRTKFPVWLPVVVLALTAIFFRLWQWRELPPGLTSLEAASGLQALVSSHNKLALFGPVDGYSPLWNILLGLAVSLFGATISALRVVAVGCSLIALLATYGWVNSIYGKRIAWVAAFFMSVTPWSVTLSRNALPTILGLAVFSLLLWAFSEAVKKPARRSRLLTLAAAIVLSALTGPWGWFGLIIIVLAAASQPRSLQRALSQIKMRSSALIGLALVFAAALSLAGTLIGLNFADMTHTFGFAAVSEYPIRVLNILNTFVYHGDPEFSRNMGSQPLLNAFVTLILVAGLMVMFSRFQRARDRGLLVLLVLTMVPAVVSGGVMTNSDRLALALPVIMLIAAIGVFYLLDLWNATFPINSAARMMGQTAIALLLILTAYQGYTQYFVAWANSSQTYVAYNRSATQASIFYRSLPISAKPILVAEPNELVVAKYLTNNATVLLPGDINQLPTDHSYRLIFTATTHDQVVPLLVKHLPGGTIKPHLDRDLTELYYEYVITK